ncbi:MAG TPA: response regulator [Chloroflexota bacterium]
MLSGRVVVALEEPETLDLVKVNLEQAGYEALAATDGIAAYEAVERGNPVAVILDLSLPSLSGFRLVKLLKRDPRWRDVPLIVTSAYPFEEVEDITHEGIDGFVARPFSPHELVNRLEYALSRQRQLAVAV